jgi:hypothetical protein
MKKPLKKFDNIDHYSRIYKVQAAAEEEGGEIDSSDPGLEEGDFDLSSFFGGMGPGGTSVEDQTSKKEAVRDWLLRRENTLYPHEIRKKMELEMPVEVKNPFADPEEDITDVFYPGGSDGNPNTEDVSEPIVYDPFSPEPVEQEIDATQELGGPEGENTVNYQCLNSAGNIVNDPETGGNVFDSERCGELGGTWTLDDFNLNEPDEPAGGPPAEGRLWSTKEKNDFADSNFLYIKPNCGEKDSENKTKPRKCRMFPYKNKKGNINLPHLRNAIARIPQARSLSKQTRDNLTRKAKAILKREKEKRKNKRKNRR